MTQCMCVRGSVHELHRNKVNVPVKLSRMLAAYVGCRRRRRAVLLSQQQLDDVSQYVLFIAKL